MAAEPFPAVNLGQRRFDTSNLREELPVRRFDEGAIANTGRDVLHPGNLTDGAGVLQCQRGGRAQPAGDVHALAAAREVARADLNDVGARRLERCLDRPARAGTKRHHGNHGGNANHHAQHGQPRAQAVAAKRTHGDLGANDEEAQHGLDLRLGAWDLGLGSSFAAQGDDGVEP